MAQILGPGETLANGQLRTDETFRFHLAFQPDGNLVVYAHVIAPDEQKVAIGATGTDGMGPNVQLHLNAGGWLEMLDSSDGGRRWFRPLRFSTSRGVEPWGIPNSTLHLQADGRLVLYRPGGFSPDHATWAIAGVEQPTEDLCVIPGTLTVDVSAGGVLSPAIDKRIVNDSNTRIGVRDGRNYLPVAPGSQVGIAAPGRLAVETKVYFREPGQPSSTDARVYSADEEVIRIGGSSDGFSLT